MNNIYRETPNNFVEFGNNFQRLTGHSKNKKPGNTSIYDVLPGLNDFRIRVF